MIIELTVENYKSIKDKITLSMIATTDTSFKETLIPLDEKVNLLPLASIYGANGAGKTNIIDALGYIKFLVERSTIEIQHGDPIPFFPHRLSDKDKPTSVEVHFTKDGNRYAYGVSLNRIEITQEYLYHFPNGRQAKIFEREKENYNFGVKYNKELTDLKEKSKNNRLYLSTAASWTNMPEIIEPFNFFKESLIVNKSLDNDDWLDYTINSIQDNSNYKQLFLTLLKDFNLGITDIEAKLEIKDISNDDLLDLPQGFPEELKSFMTKTRSVKREVKLFYDNMKVDLREESRGIRKIFEIGGPILDILSNGKILVFDELETSLHPNLVLYLIELFKNPKINKKNAQLIFTTHDTNLLDLNKLRRDQIWLVEKDSSFYSSDLYSISDLKNVRKDENIEKGYIRGKYGAIPFPGSELVRDWVENNYGE